jgi:hypothetical protein
MQQSRIPRVHLFWFLLSSRFRRSFISIPSCKIEKGFCATKEEGERCHVGNWTVQKLSLRPVAQWRKQKLHSYTGKEMETSLNTIQEHILPNTTSLQGVFTVLFFGEEIQPKHLVFCYLGFLPGFSLVFCFLPHPMHSFLKKTKLFCFCGFFSLVFKNQATAWLLGFLEVVCICNIRTK